MTFLGRALRTLLGPLRDSRGLSLYEVTAAVAMTAIIAAVAIPVALDRIEDAKKARATLEVEAISKAMLRFFQDTGKWPGELEMFNSKKGVFLKSGSPSSQGGPPFPKFDLPPAITIPIDGTVVDCPPGGFDSSESSALNINNYLVNKPSGYANWRGPYVDQIETDPFEKAYVIHVLPLFCGEKATSTTKLGYGWVLSAGPDQVLQQDLLKAKLDVTKDDSGRNNGKRTIITQ